jgi:hypothetical protein
MGAGGGGATERDGRATGSGGSGREGAALRAAPLTPRSTGAAGDGRGLPACGGETRVALAGFLGCAFGAAAARRAAAGEGTAGGGVRFAAREAGVRGAEEGIFSF